MATLWIILILKLVMVTVSCLTPDEIEAERSGWNADPTTQYHIQTDEGPERYFRFQTLNGQFRKEKRLEDGTVIGTEGWLDPLGYLRIKDYIADHNGYRILRSKTVFVGKDKPIGDAVTISRRFPPQSGILAQSRRPPNPFRQATFQELSDNSVEGNSIAIKPYHANSIKRTNVPHSRYYSSTILPPIVGADETYNEFTKPLMRNYNSLDGPHQLHVPRAPIYKSYHQLVKPALEIEPPLNSYRDFSRQPVTITARPRTIAAVYPSDSRGYRSDGFDNRAKDRRTQAKSHSIDRFDDLAKGNVHAIHKELPQYDGSHTVSDGFQYYLKSHYHEEEEKPNNEKVGSFGYVDPFGIRRVVYYKADGRGGFVHKKNNRYVGPNATPYDPLRIE